MAAPAVVGVLRAAAVVALLADVAAGEKARARLAAAAAATLAGVSFLPPLPMLLLLALAVAGAIGFV